MEKKDEIIIIDIFMLLSKRIIYTVFLFIIS